MTWREVEDNGVGDKELLVARDYKRCWKICGRMWYVSEDEDQDGSTSREVEFECGAGKTVNTSNSGLYYKVTISSWEECYPSGL